MARNIEIKARIASATLLAALGIDSSQHLAVAHVDLLAERQESVP
jgi:hypothetical protein